MFKELRLAGISNIQDANVFLHKVYIPQHNARFAVDPADPKDGHRPLFKTHRLEEILSIRIKRVIANDFTVRLNNTFFQLKKDQSIRIQSKDSLLVETRLDGSIHMRFKDRYLAYKTLPHRPYAPFNATHREQVSQFKSPCPILPPMSHPWKGESFRKMMLKKAFKNNRMEYRKNIKKLKLHQAPKSTLSKKWRGK